VSLRYLFVALFCVSTNADNFATVPASKLMFDTKKKLFGNEKKLRVGHVIKLFSGKKKKVDIENYSNQKS
jgi:hypothetical protein